MNEILNRLADLILCELERRNISCLAFGELCGLSKNQIGYIVNRNKTDIKLSTIVKICENSNIQIEHIFCDCKTEKIMNNAVILINGSKFKMELKEYSEIHRM